MNTYSTLAGRLPTVRSCCAVLIGLLLACASLGQTLPPGFTVDKVQDSYDAPVGLAFSATDKQLFVWERKGVVWVSDWNGSTYVRQSTPVIDLSEEVGNWGEVGMMGLCLDPDFSRNGLIYLFYAVDRHHLLYYGTPQYDPTANLYNEASIGRVTRYRISRSGGRLVADYASRKVLLGETRQTGLPLLKGNHLGGALVMGSDGTLLLSTGDNAAWAAADLGNSPDTYYQTALTDGIIRPAENVGAFRAQLINSLCGKILRIDAHTGDGLPSNPFYDPGQPRSAQSRVWAMGFRNPFRMSLQPTTGSADPAEGNPGTLLVGDVGWFGWEELNVIDQPGLNAGWPLYEGMDQAPDYYGTNIPNTDEAGQPTFERLCQPPTTPIIDSNPANRRLTHYRPALDWLHDRPVARVPAFDGNAPTPLTLGTPGAPSGVPFGGNCAIGGVCYTSNQFPVDYQNTYFLADYGQGWIRNIVFHDAGDHWVHEVREFAPAGFAQNVVALAVNPLDGSLYYVDGYNGMIERITYGGNRPPVARISVDTTYGRSPLTVHFRGESSSDPDGNSISYEWDFGDGSQTAEANPVHTFLSDSVKGFRVTLTVRDGQGLSDAQTLTISVNNQGPPAVRITNPTDGMLYPLDRVSQYTLSANASDQSGNESTPQFVQTYQWQVILRHNTHEHRQPVITAISPTIDIDPTGCEAGETYYYLIRCTVTDNGGLTATDSVRLYPDCASGTVTVRQVIASPQVAAVRLTWVNPAVPFDEVLVAARPDSGFTDRPGGTNYVADPDFGGKGSLLDGGKVVYRGRDTTVTVTALSPSNMYFFRVYTRVGNGWNGGVEVSAWPLADTSCAMYTLRPGNWDNPAIWSCNRIPTRSDVVFLRHWVNILPNYKASAKMIVYNSGIDLRFGTDATLELNP